MKHTRTPREDEPKHRRGANEDSRAEATWYEDGARPVDQPLIATIPLPDGR
jgi:hypothetical protein